MWAELHAVLLDRLAEADRLDWNRASHDSASVPAPLAKKGEHPRRWSARVPLTEGNKAPGVTWS